MHKTPNGITSSFLSFLQSFRRVTTTGNFIAEIDGLRLMAIGTVLLFHLALNLSIKSPAAYPVAGQGHWISSITHYGAHGVELFFIISGFILALPFAAHHLTGGKQVRLGSYYMRRVTRLEPPYIISLIGMFVLILWFKNVDVAEYTRHFLASLTYSHNLIYRAESFINNVAWSLEIEIQFYLLVPLISNVFAIRNKAARRMVIGSVALCTILGEWLWIDSSSIFYLTIVRFLHFFLMGFLLADVFLTDWHEHPPKTWRWDIVSLVGWPALFFVWNHPGLSAWLPYGTIPIVAAFFFPLGAFTLYLAAFRGSITNRIFRNPLVTTIGGMCYSIYLLHNPLLGVFLSLTKSFVPTADYNLNLILQGMLVLPPVIIVSALYYALIERPCMRKDWPQRFWKRITLPFSKTVKEGIS